MPRCGRCETLPEPVEGDLTLHLWVPMGHTHGRVAAALRGGAWTAEVDPGDGHLRLDVPGAEVGALVEALDAGLSSLERDDMRVLAKPRAAPPSLADIGSVRPWAQFAALVQSRWILTMLAESRLTSVFHPIVHAGEPTRAFAQEALLRGVDAAGAHVAPARLFEAARAAGLLFQLDLAARRTAIAAAAAHGVREVLFINFTPTAIYDPATCLRSTVAAIDAAGIAHDRVVFEVIESDRTVDVAHLRRILDRYRDAGFRVALDDLGAGYSSLNLMHQLRPDFIKLDRELVSGVHGDRHKAMVAATILDLAGRLDVPTIAEGIETPEELEWAVRHGATYAQGYLFARPSAAPLSTLPAPPTLSGPPAAVRRLAVPSGAV